MCVCSISLFFSLCSALYLGVVDARAPLFLRRRVCVPPVIGGGGAMAWGSGGWAKLPTSSSLALSPLKYIIENKRNDNQLKQARAPKKQLNYCFVRHTQKNDGASKQEEERRALRRALDRRQQVHAARLFCFVCVCVCV